MHFNLRVRKEKTARRKRKVSTLRQNQRKRSHRHKKSILLKQRRAKTAQVRTLLTGGGGGGKEWRESMMFVKPLLRVQLSANKLEVFCKFKFGHENGNSVWGTERLRSNFQLCCIWSILIVSILECVTFRGDHLWETWRRHFVQFLFVCKWALFRAGISCNSQFFLFASVFLNNAKERKKIFDWLVLPQ